MHIYQTHYNDRPIKQGSLHNDTTTPYNMSPEHPTDKENDSVTASSGTTSPSHFISFDIEEFYPAINSDLLNKALDFASRYANIRSEERSNIVHARSSMLTYKKQHWQKKGPTAFGITMGSFDGAEACELVGSFLLSQLQQLLSTSHLGSWKTSRETYTPSSTATNSASH